MTTEEAQQLIQITKKLMESGSVYLPKQGEQKKVELQSIFSANDKFEVIINRMGHIRTDKYTLMLRYGKDHGLLRIDVTGPDHDNPDGSIVPCPHIHYQKTNTGAWDSWAMPLPALFGSVDDRVQMLRDFFEYCNVNNISSIEICEQTEMR